MLSEVTKCNSCGNCTNCTIVDLGGYGDDNSFRCNLRDYLVVSSTKTCREHKEGEPSMISFREAEVRGIQ